MTDETMTADKAVDETRKELRSLTADVRKKIRAEVLDSDAADLDTWEDLVRVLRRKEAIKVVISILDDLETGHVQPGYYLERRDGLTKREREVLAYVADGIDQASMARDLGLTRQRVGQLITSLLTKGYIRKSGADGYKLRRGVTVTPSE